ncbi:hypothetical protein ACH9L7_01820 [Haloferax sp. S1W]|uniref:DUF7130 family rubredoxin-like protein n=1 Tax=Haloferax sp. S1W TaxID=3377110 RepID=UPI0037CAC540
MAIKTPTRPIRPLEEDQTAWETAERSATTESRAVNPPVVVEHRTLPRKDYGEAHLAWVCDECGAAGPLTAFPSSCPDCDAEREALFYYTED